MESKIALRKVGNCLGHSTHAFLLLVFVGQEVCVIYTQAYIAHVSSYINLLGIYTARHVKVGSVSLFLHIQWNLRTKDTLGPIVLSLVERLSLSRR